MIFVFAVLLKQIFLDATKFGWNKKFGAALALECLPPSRGYGLEWLVGNAFTVPYSNQKIAGIIQCILSKLISVLISEEKQCF